MKETKRTRPVTYTREQLIALCERAIVPHNKWGNRDSAAAQRGVGKLWALLKCGCAFEIMRRKKFGDICITDDRTIYVTVTLKGFGTFEGGPKETEIFYLPTEKRLQEYSGDDWY